MTALAWDAHWDTFWFHYDLIGDKLPRATFFALLIAERTLKRALLGSTVTLGELAELVGKAREVTNLVACAQDLVEAARGNILHEEKTLEQASSTCSFSYSCLAPFVTLNNWSLLPLGRRAQLLEWLTDGLFIGKHGLMLWSKAQEIWKESSREKLADGASSSLELLDAINEAASFKAFPFPLQLLIGLASGGYGVHRSWCEISSSS